MINPRHLIAVIVTKNFYKGWSLTDCTNPPVHHCHQGRRWLRAALPPRHRAKFAFRSFGQHPLWSFCQAAAGMWEELSKFTRSSLKLLKSTSSNSLQLDRASRSASAPAKPLLSLPKHLVEAHVEPKGSGTKATAGGRLKYQGSAANKIDFVEHPPTCRGVFQYWLVAIFHNVVWSWFCCHAWWVWYTRRITHVLKVF